MFAWNSISLQFHFSFICANVCMLYTGSSFNFSPLRLSPFGCIFISSVSGRILVFPEVGLILFLSCVAFVRGALGFNAPRCSFSRLPFALEQCVQLALIFQNGLEPRHSTFNPIRAGLFRSAFGRALWGGVWNKRRVWRNITKKAARSPPVESLRGAQHGKGPDESCRGQVGHLSLSPAVLLGGLSPLFQPEVLKKTLSWPKSLFGLEQNMQYFQHILFQER